MSEWIDNFVKQLEKEIAERQLVLDAIKSTQPKPKKPRKKRRAKIKEDRQLTPEQRELSVNLRTSMVGMRPAEREKLSNGDIEVAHVTSGGNQDG